MQYWLILLATDHNSVKVKPTVPFMMETQMQMSWSNLPSHDDAWIMCHIAYDKAQHSSWHYSVYLCFHINRNSGFDIVTGLVALTLGAHVLQMV